MQILGGASDWALKKFIKFSLSRCLGRYLQSDLDTGQIDFELSSGKLELRDVLLDCGAINEDLALHGWSVKAGYIGSATTQIPFLKGQTSSTVDITLDEVLLTVVPDLTNLHTASPTPEWSKDEVPAAPPPPRFNMSDLGLGYCQVGVAEGIKRIATGLRELVRRLRLTATNVTLRIELPLTDLKHMGHSYARSPTSDEVGIISIKLGRFEYQDLGVAANSTATAAATAAAAAAVATGIRGGGGLGGAPASGDVPTPGDSLKGVELRGISVACRVGRSVLRSEDGGGACPGPPIELGVDEGGPLGPRALALGIQASEKDGTTFKPGASPAPNSTPPPPLLLHGNSTQGGIDVSATMRLSWVGDAFKAATANMPKPNPTAPTPPRTPLRPPPPKLGIISINIQCLGECRINAHPTHLACVEVLTTTLKQLEALRPPPPPPPTYSPSVLGLAPDTAPNSGPAGGAGSLPYTHMADSFYGAQAAGSGGAWGLASSFMHDLLEPECESLVYMSVGPQVVTESMLGESVMYDASSANNSFWASPADMAAARAQVAAEKKSNVSSSLVDLAASNCSDSFYDAHSVAGSSMASSLMHSHFAPQHHQAAGKSMAWEGVDQLGPAHSKVQGHSKAADHHQTAQDDQQLQQQQMGHGAVEGNGHYTGRADANSSQSNHTLGSVPDRTAGSAGDTPVSPPAPFWSFTPQAAPEIPPPPPLPPAAPIPSPPPVYKYCLDVRMPVLALTLDYPDPSACSTNPGSHAPSTKKSGSTQAINPAPALRNQTPHASAPQLPSSSSTSSRTPLAPSLGPPPPSQSLNQLLVHCSLLHISATSGGGAAPTSGGAPGGRGGDYNNPVRPSAPAPHAPTREGLSIRVKMGHIQVTEQLPLPGGCMNKGAARVVSEFVGVPSRLPNPIRPSFRPNKSGLEVWPVLSCGMLSKTGESMGPCFSLEYDCGLDLPPSPPDTRGVAPQRPHPGAHRADFTSGGEGSGLSPQPALHVHLDCAPVLTWLSAAMLHRLSACVQLYQGAINPPDTADSPTITAGTDAADSTRSTASVAARVGHGGGGHGGAGHGGVGGGGHGGGGHVGPTSTATAKDQAGGAAQGAEMQAVGQLGLTASIPRLCVMLLPDTSSWAPMDGKPDSANLFAGLCVGALDIISPPTRNPMLKQPSTLCLGQAQAGPPLISVTPGGRDGMSSGIEIAASSVNLFLMPPKGATAKPSQPSSHLASTKSERPSRSGSSGSGGLSAGSTADALASSAAPRCVLRLEPLPPPSPSYVLGRGSAVSDNSKGNGSESADATAGLGLFIQFDIQSGARGIPGLNSEAWEQACVHSKDQWAGESEGATWGDGEGAQAAADFQGRCIRSSPLSVHAHIPNVYAALSQQDMASLSLLAKGWSAEESASQAKPHAATPLPSLPPLSSSGPLPTSSSLAPPAVPKRPSQISLLISAKLHCSLLHSETIPSSQAKQRTAAESLQRSSPSTSAPSPSPSQSPSHPPAPGLGPPNSSSHPLGPGRAPPNSSSPCPPPPENPTPSVVKAESLFDLDVDSIVLFHAANLSGVAGASTSSLHATGVRLIRTACSPSTALSELLVPSQQRQRRQQEGAQGGPAQRQGWQPYCLLYSAADKPADSSSAIELFAASRPLPSPQGGQDPPASNGPPSSSTAKTNGSTAPYEAPPWVGGHARGANNSGTHGSTTRSSERSGGEAGKKVAEEKLAAHGGYMSTRQAGSSGGQPTEQLVSLLVRGLTLSTDHGCLTMDWISQLIAMLHSPTEPPASADTDPPAGDAPRAAQSNSTVTPACSETSPLQPPESGEPGSWAAVTPNAASLSGRPASLSGRPASLSGRPASLSGSAAPPPPKCVVVISLHNVAVRHEPLPYPRKHQLALGTNAIPAPPPGQHSPRVSPVAVVLLVGATRLQFLGDEGACNEHELALHSLGLHLALADSRGPGWGPGDAQDVGVCNLQAAGYHCVLQEPALHLRITPSAVCPCGRTRCERIGHRLLEVEVTNRNLSGALNQESAALLVQLVAQITAFMPQPTQPPRKPREKESPESGSETAGANSGQQAGARAGGVASKDGEGILSHIREDEFSSVRISNPQPGVDSVSGSAMADGDWYGPGLAAVSLSRLGSSRSSTELKSLELLESGGADCLPHPEQVQTIENADGSMCVLIEDFFQPAVKQDEDEWLSSSEEEPSIKEDKHLRMSDEGVGQWYSSPSKSTPTPPVLKDDHYKLADGTSAPGSLPPMISFNQMFSSPNGPRSARRTGPSGGQAAAPSMSWTSIAQDRGTISCAAAAANAADVNGSEPGSEARSRPVCGSGSTNGPGPASVSGSGPGCHPGLGPGSANGSGPGSGPVLASGLGGEGEGDAQAVAAPGPGSRSGAGARSRYDDKSRSDLGGRSGSGAQAGASQSGGPLAGACRGAVEAEGVGVAPACGASDSGVSNAADHGDAGQMVGAGGKKSDPETSTNPQTNAGSSPGARADAFASAFAGAGADGSERVEEMSDDDGDAWRCPSSRIVLKGFSGAWVLHLGRPSLTSRIEIEVSGLTLHLEGYGLDGHMVRRTRLAVHTLEVRDCSSTASLAGGGCSAAGGSCGTARGASASGHRRKGGSYSLAPMAAAAAAATTTHRWTKILSYRAQPLQPRDLRVPMIALSLEAVRPDPEGDPTVEELRLQVALLPLRLKLDQDVVESLRSLSTAIAGQLGPAMEVLTAVQTHMLAMALSCESPLPCHDSYSTGSVVASSLVAPPFFQFVDVQGFSILLDYRPHRVDVAALRDGVLLELLNLVPWGGIDLELKHLRLAGLEGWDGLGSTLGRAWLKDISQTQAQKFLVGMAPVNYICKASTAMKGLFAPGGRPSSYNATTNRALKELRKAANVFAKGLVTEASLKAAGAKVVAGTKLVLRSGSAAIGSISSPSLSSVATPLSDAGLGSKKAA